jgi:hypothetical protein
MQRKSFYTHREIRRVLRKELKLYEASFDDLAPDERKALREWVNDGDSVHDNPSLIAGEDGNLLCYISAIRLVADMWNNPEDYSF